MEVNINLFLLFYRKHFLQEPRVFLSDIHLTQLRNVFKTFLTNSFAVGCLYQTFVQINSKYVYDALLMSGVDAMSEIGEGSEIFHNISSHQTSDQGGGGEAARMIDDIYRMCSQFLRLYRGLTTPLCTVALTNAVTFGVYGIVSRDVGNSTTLEVARNGIVAGIVRVSVE